MVKTFSLLTEPWLPVLLHNGETKQLSLIEVFEKTPNISSLTGALPTEVFATTRLLLSVMHRAIPLGDDPLEDWGNLWRAASLPTGDITDYLRRWEDRFDLLHPTQPFMQAPNLHTAKDEPSLERLIVDSTQDGLFTTRRGTGLERISFAEAARMIVHSQAFSVSGIFPQALGDPRGKGGKVYPLGTGFAGTLGGLILEGRSLKDTLLLNFRPDELAETLSEDDAPVWERAPLAPLPEERIPEGPRGQADLFTWPSRRIRLVHDDEGVTGAIVCYGDPLTPQNLHAVETMSAWRYCEPQSKKFGKTVYMPLEHRADRAVWRGLSSLLPHAMAIQNERSIRRALTIQWVDKAIDADLVPADYLIQTHIIGMEYGTQNAVIAQVISDRLSMHVALLNSTNIELATAALDEVSRTEDAVRALGYLARDLSQAAGGDGVGDVENATRQGYDQLDPLFRRWIENLTLDTDIDAAITQWRTDTRSCLTNIANELIAAAGTAAWIGRDVQGSHLNSARASLKFSSALNKALPVAPHTLDESQLVAANTTTPTAQETKQ